MKGYSGNRCVRVEAMGSSLLFGDNVGYVMSSFAKFRPEDDQGIGL